MPRLSVAIHLPRWLSSLFRIDSGGQGGTAGDLWVYVYGKALHRHNSGFPEARWGWAASGYRRDTYTVWEYRTLMPAGMPDLPWTCASYREFNHAEGYRVLYSVEGILVTAHVILSPRQDIPRLLFKCLIMAWTHWVGCLFALTLKLLFLARAFLCRVTRRWTAKIRATRQKPPLTQRFFYWS